jgi:hypothetical protein
MGCRLDDASTGDPAALRSALSKELGAKATVSGRTLTVAAASERAAWSAGAYAVAKASVHGATSVRVGSREWTRTRNSSGWEWHDADGGKANTVTVTFAG